DTQVERRTETGKAGQVSLDVPDALPAFRLLLLRVVEQGLARLDADDDCSPVREHPAEVPLPAARVEDSTASHVAEQAQQHRIEEVAFGEVAIRVQLFERVAGAGAPAPDRGFVRPLGHHFGPRYAGPTAASSNRFRAGSRRSRPRRARVFAAHPG